MSMDKSIGSASVRLSKKITRVVNLHLKSYHITTEQWAVLRTLHETDQITQKELSHRTDKDQATLTKILDLIEKREWIRRVSNPADRRSFLIEITEQGRALVQELTSYIEEIFSKIVAGIEQEKLDVYQEVMHLMESNIDQLLDRE
ncbi:MarR family transcriptional regulator [Robertmurraya massiliosenegalensis]|uniref:MarR family winged helix-turn-helix transcriptional regulator n=1 Tax=Robertmurraya TaxID=2837507 RepID=UPI0039A442BE